MSNDNTRELVLAINQYAYIQDETKGAINVYVGPNKASLSPTDRPMRFNEGRFERCDLGGAIREFPLVPEGSYFVLHNPAHDKEHPYPPLGLPTAAARLDNGRKINIPGPLSVPLWPGQTATVIEGHRLRSNQYLLVRVYNEATAREHWDTAIVKSPTGSETEESKPLATTVDLSTGKLLVIRGVDVSFYIPPTGIEVLKDAKGQFIRDAETLERLEYCILLDESGEKSVMKGPSVVFPRPTQTFVEENSARKFRATELNPDMGIHIKVTADYEDQGQKYKTGEELFITGREQQIYYPRPEHAIIKYGNRQITYGVTIPEGEARYVLNKETGNVDLVRGPRIFTPDPRKQVLVRRVLELREVGLYYPGNTYAIEYNQQLLDVLRQTQASAVAAAGAVEEATFRNQVNVTRNVGAVYSASLAEFNRGNSYTPPRTLTLDTKYEGAVAIQVWEGYCIKVNRKNGESRVVVGPKTELLGYDETLQVMHLSTGKPKSQDRLQSTVYLRVMHNQVSDLVDVTTKDLVTAQLKISYRVNFTGDPVHWFRVENYVKYLTDHGRSLLRAVTKRHGVEDFYANHIQIVRDALLGAKPDGGKRAGLSFEENGMHAYDVEVLDLKLGDAQIAQLLYDAQHETVKTALSLGAAVRTLETDRRLAEIDIATKQLEADEVKRRFQLMQAKLLSEADLSTQRWDLKEAELERAAMEGEAARVQEKADLDLDLQRKRQDQVLRIQLLEAEAASLLKRAEAIGPDLVAALQAFGSQMVTTEAAKAMAPLALLGGRSIADVLTRLFSGTHLGDALAKGLVGRALPEMTAMAPNDSPD